MPNWLNLKVQLKIFEFLTGLIAKIMKLADSFLARIAKVFWGPQKRGGKLKSEEKCA